MKQLFLTLALVGTVLSANATVNWTLGDGSYMVDTLSHFTAGPGITTTSIRLQSLSSSEANNVFYTTIDLTNPMLAIRGVQAKDGYYTESVKAMGERKNMLDNGNYVAGINGDFFNMGAAEGSIATSGASIVDGTIYTATCYDYMSSVIVHDNRNIRIAEGLDVMPAVVQEDGTFYRYYVNAARLADYLVIYTPDFGENTATNEWGIECTAKIISGSIEGGDAVLEVTGPLLDYPDKSMEIPKDGVVLSGHGAGHTFLSTLSIGDQLSLNTVISLNGEEIDPTQVVSGCSMLVMNGAVAADKYLSSSLIDHFESYQARSAIGYDKDRTQLIILVVDKFTSPVGDYGPSTGLYNRQVAQLLVKLGCYTAMNLDGGGSSQLYNQNLGIQNVPYGDTSYLRPVANGIFAVDTNPADDEIAYIEVKQKNVSVSSGKTFTPTVYGYNKYGVLVNGNLSGCTLSVASALGEVSGTTFTAGSTSGSTIAVVSYGNVKCGVVLHTNGGGAYVTSGDDNAELMVPVLYESVPVELSPYIFTTEWSFVNTDYNDGWDSTDPNWSSETAIKSKPCPRFATGMDGKFYTLNMKTMSIAEIDENGTMTDKYKLPSLEGSAYTDGTADYYGTAISRDDAGNFIIGHYFTKAFSNTAYTIYSPSQDKAKHFYLTLVGDERAARIDNIGRAVGDVTKDGYLYIAPNNSAGSPFVNTILHFTGDGDVDSVELENTCSSTTYMAASVQNGICQPAFESAEEVTSDNLLYSFYLYSKEPNSYVNFTWDRYLYRGADMNINYANINGFVNTSTLNGFDTFTLNGERFFAISYCDEANKAANPSAHWIAIINEKAEIVAEYNLNDRYVTNYGYMTITAEKLSESSVNIYVYNCVNTYASIDGETGTGAIVGSKLNFSLRENGDDDDNKEDSGITDTIAPEAIDGPAVYYNLQGVQVASPGHGVYILRRGNTATKVYIR